MAERSAAIRLETVLRYPQTVTRTEVVSLSDMMSPRDSRSLLALKTTFTPETAG
jgi:hypothetical protein